jgi:hypothetical protein
MLTSLVYKNVGRAKTTFGALFQQATTIWRRSPNFVNAAVAFTLAAIILFLRKPDAVLNPQFWAEDGQIFYYQSATLGLDSIFTPYVGYYHFIPRILSLIYISIIPTVDLPAAYNFTAWLVSALTFAFIAVSRIEVPCKWAFAICPLLMPHGGEVFINFTDIQWIVAPVLVIFCIEPPAQDRKTIVFECFLAVVIGLTGPFSLMIFPLFCIRLAANKFARTDIPLFVAITLAAGIQAYALLGNDEVSSQAIMTWKNVPAWFASNGLAPLFGSALFPHRPTHAAVVGCAVASCALAAGLIGLSPLWRMRAGAMLAFALITLSAAAHKHGDSLLPVINPHGGGQRYFYLAYAMIGWALFILATKGGRYWNVVGIIALSLGIGSSTQHFVAAPMEDLHWRDRIEALQGEGEVPINPTDRAVHVFKNRQ